jgi:tetratricopeptide (TPR) repeat protein
MNDNNASEQDLEPTSTAQTVSADEDGSRWEVFVDYLVELWTGSADLLNAWYWTRPWREICLRAGVVLAIVCIPIGLLVGSMLVRRHALVDFYSSLLGARSAVSADQSARSKESDPSTMEKDDSAFVARPVGAAGKLAARRLLQLNDRHELAHFIIATDLARSGKIAQARQLMSKVSPADGSGFAPGHAWLAESYLSRGTFDASGEATRDRVMHHVEQGVRWAGAGPQLRAFFATAIERQGEYDRAAEVLSGAVKQDPRIVAVLATMVRRHKLDHDYRSEIGEARGLLEQRLSSGGASIDDHFALASLLLVNGDPAEALQRVDAIAKIEPNHPSLPRLRSEAFRQQYRQAITKQGDGIIAGLDLLDAALKADPSNPAIDSEIMYVIAQGIDVPGKLDDYLNERIASGSATALTHFILANQKIQAGKVKEAIPHLEVGLKLAPGSALMMNNLAYALALSAKTELPRALGLIAEAVNRSPGDPNLFETQGEIFLIARQPLDAVAALEKALSIDKRRISTRRLLVDAYEQAGLQDLAKAQKEFIAKMLPEPTADANVPNDDKLPNDAKADPGSR